MPATKETKRLGHSGLVQVSPQERIRRNEGESDTAVRRRYEADQKTAKTKAAENRENTRFYDQREKAKGFSEQAGYDIARALGKQFAKGGSVSSRADGCCIKGKTRGKVS